MPPETYRVISKISALYRSSQDGSKEMPPFLANLFLRGFAFYRSLSLFRDMPLAFLPMASKTTPAARDSMNMPPHIAQP